MKAKNDFNFTWFVIIQLIMILLKNAGEKILVFLISFYINRNPEILALDGRTNMMSVLSDFGMKILFGSMDALKCLGTAPIGLALRGFIK